MFDMNGRIGDWKFQRVSRTKPLFESLGNNPGTPDAPSAVTEIADHYKQIASPSIIECPWKIGDRVRVKAHCQNYPGCHGVVTGVILDRGLFYGSVIVVLDELRIGHPSFGGIAYWSPQIEPEESASEDVVVDGLVIPKGWVYEKADDVSSLGKVIAQWRRFEVGYPNALVYRYYAINRDSQARAFGKYATHDRGWVTNAGLADYASLSGAILAAKRCNELDGIKE